METLTVFHILLAASDSEYAGKTAQAERAHVLALTSERRKRKTVLKIQIFDGAMMGPAFHVH